MIPILDLIAEPVYGLASSVVFPGLSVILSIVMIFGVDYLGITALKIMKFRYLAEHRWLRSQGVVIGSALIALIIYPMALVGNLSRLNAQICAITLVIVGLIHGSNLIKKIQWNLIYANIKNVIKGNAKVRLNKIIFWAIFIGLGLLALAPVTDADSLDYHIGVALSILNTGAFPFTPEWFHSRLAGSGESLIALGLSLGAEQFGSLLQFSGLVGIISIFRYVGLINKGWRLLCLLGVISTPILVPWVASPKPFLMPVAMTTAALMLTIIGLADPRNHLRRLDSLKFFSLICLLVMTAAVTKLNFMLSGGIISLIAIAYMARKDEVIYASIIGIMMVAIIMGPPSVWKYLNYGGSIFSSFFTPFPGEWPGTKEFEDILRAHRETIIIFPISLIIPSNLGSITTVLGFGVAIIFASLIKKNNHIVKLLIVIASVVAILGVAFGQISTRFFIEPYLWLMLAAMLSNQTTVNKFYHIGTVGIIIQSICVICIIIIGITTLTVGSLSSEFRHKTMSRHAMGYLEMRWANSVLPLDAKLIIKSRSMALSSRYTISSDWQSYNSITDTRSMIYEKITALKLPEFIMFKSEPDIVPNLNLCDGEIFAGPFQTKLATRNSFNSGSPYDVWIIRLNYPGANCKL